MLRNWAVASQQDRDRCRQCALLPAGRGTVTIAAARLLRCRRAREHYPCVTTRSLPRVPVVLRLPGRGRGGRGRKTRSSSRRRGWLIPASTGARRLPILGPADEAPAHRLPPASDVGEVLDIWQRINDSERRARFLASPALGDLVQFPADVLWERGRRLYQAHGRLLLNDSFPGARPENVAQVIMHIADASTAARREPGRREAASKGRVSAEARYLS